MTRKKHVNRYDETLQQGEGTRSNRTDLLSLHVNCIRLNHY